jgi:hypothetical protein
VLRRALLLTACTGVVHAYVESLDATHNTHTADFPHYCYLAYNFVMLQKTEGRPKINKSFKFGKFKPFTTPIVRTVKAAGFGALKFFNLVGTSTDGDRRADDGMYIIYMIKSRTWYILLYKA